MSGGTKINARDRQNFHHNPYYSESIKTINYGYNNNILYSCNSSFYNYKSPYKKG